MVSSKITPANFRDVAVSIGLSPEQKLYIKPDMLTRSATMDNMSNEDVSVFVNAYHTRTILDLRTSQESKGSFPIDAVFPSWPEKEELVNEKSWMRRKVKISFASWNFKKNYIFGRSSLLLKLWILLLALMFQFQWAAYVVGKYVVSPGGVVQLYKASLKYSSEEIKRALTLFTDETHFPIHVHCSHGKDRTGMVVALVLAICGVPEEQIVLDYAKSEAGLAPVHDALAKDIQRSGLSDEFMHTPPQNMRDLFNYLKKQYGSIPEYLESIGFDTKAQEKVRSILCASLPKA